MEPEEVANCLVTLLESQEFNDEGENDGLGLLPVRKAVNFNETGLLTRDAGVLLRLEDGSEFQITVVQSLRAAKENNG